MTISSIPHTLNEEHRLPDNMSATDTPASENQPRIVTDAGAPFDNANADVILRSADNVDFRVFKLLLSLASPFFDDMFALPQAPEGDNSNETKEGLPVVQMMEERRALEMLLLACYPMSAVDSPDPETLAEVHLLLEAAVKYGVERVEKRIREWLVTPRFLHVDPVRVFAIACHYQFQEEAKLAAEATVFRSLSKRPYGGELDLIMGGQMYQLLQYHASCVEEAKKIFTNFTWIEQTSFCWFNCDFCGSRYESAGPRGSGICIDNWWYNFMLGLPAALGNRGWDETRISSLVETALQGANVNCGGKAGRARAEMQTFMDILHARIKEVVSKVSLFVCLDLHLLHDTSVDRFSWICDFSSGNRSNLECHTRERIS